jgi:hypothetical protein
MTVFGEQAIPGILSKHGCTNPGAKLADETHTPPGDAVTIRLLIRASNRFGRPIRGRASPPLSHPYHGSPVSHALRTATHFYRRRFGVSIGGMDRKPFLRQDPIAALRSLEKSEPDPVTGSPMSHALRTATHYYRRRFGVSIGGMDRKPFFAPGPNSCVAIAREK